MQIITHRINTVAQLKNVPAQYGIELDIRYHENELVLSHDPFHHHESPVPEKFESILQHWRHSGTMILNVKTEGIESKCIELINSYNIKNWFFLDLSMPYFAVYAEKAFQKEITGFTPENLAARFSERENLEYALGFRDKAKWLWVDCFSAMPLDRHIIHKIKEAGFKTCLVSPELQHHSPERIPEFQEKLTKEAIILDAVCTKYPESWQNYENQISSY